MILETKTEN
jgi:Bardet-Biedl syndrome 7 protein